MTRPAAIQADYTNFKRVRGRRVLIIELEVPLEREREVFDVLGFPDPATGCPVAVAALNVEAGRTGGPIPHTPATQASPADSRSRHPSRPEAVSQARCSDEQSGDTVNTTISDRPRKRWNSLSRAQQAGIRCQDEQFRRWLEECSGWVDVDADEAATFVRENCGVTSRAELDRNDKAARAWDALDAEFQEWAGFLPEERS